jgi:NADPH-dependent 2,4-dienoyl-CoA reductase/sulfur reductase-like enzyme
VAAPIRQCIACNVCHDRLSAERDVTCVQNPLMGTAFETLPLAEPQLHPAPPPGGARRVLVLGAGVSGIEAARVAAALGHAVEVWERAERPGGQVDLATAAPDKREVEAAWRYPWQQAMALGVTVRTGIEADGHAVRTFDPDLVLLATGARPRPAPFDLSALDPSIPVLQAWDVLRDPARVPAGWHATIVGGGTVGMETADLLAARGVRVAVVEPKAVLGEGMSKSNRTEVADRLRAAGATVRLKTQVVAARGHVLELRGPEGTPASIEVGDLLVVAVGAMPNLDMAPVLEAAGVPWIAIGDCSQPGDFMTCLRDARMVGHAIERHAVRRVRVAPGAARLS